MSIYNYLSENFILPLADKAIGQSISKHLKFLLKSQYWTRDQLDEYQNFRLRLLVHHAYDSVPYYNDLFKKNKLTPNDIQSKSDLVKIPILTKSIIKKEGIERFTSKAINNKLIIKQSSSGSTGEPLFFLSTKDAYSINIAAELRGWYWAGYRLGDKYIKLSQNPRNDTIKRFQDIITNNRYLSTNPLNNHNFEFILNEINHYKPKVLRCYPDPLVFLAKYDQEKNILTSKLDAIVTTGNTLFPEHRSLIESTFKCKIFDTYNCEGNSNVFECPSHTCYHSTEEYGISEVLDSKEDVVFNGQGKLISTDLWNLAHPFIRYDTQDNIKVDDLPCTCGRNHFKILKILGRDNDIIETDSGQKFIVHNFTVFFQSDIPAINNSIDQFQILKRKNEILFRLVVNDNYSKIVSNFIKEYWENELKLSINIEIVSSIPLTPGGKRKFIINE
jgi:phenylacetate-CoA ligase